MNGRQLNKLAMYLAVREVLEKSEYRPVWSALRAFTLYYERWMAVVRVIEAQAVQQGASLRGIRVDKERATRFLLDVTVDVAGALASFAALTGDGELQGKTDFSRSTLANLRDAEIASRAQLIHDLAVPLEDAAIPPGPNPAPHVHDFGIAQAKLETLASRIAVYRALVESPTVARTQRKGITEEIEAQFARADELLENGPDKLIVQFTEPHPAFVRDYQNARTIIDRGGGRSGEEEPDAPSAQPANQPSPQPSSSSST